jgi:endoglucanase
MLTQRSGLIVSILLVSLSVPVMADMPVLGRGLNLGNYFEGEKTASAPLNEGSWNGGRTAGHSDFARMRAAGFNTVRIPVRWSAQAGDEPPFTIAPVFLDRMHQVVRDALDAGLIVVLNVHHFNELFDAGSKMPWETARAKLLALWDQIDKAFPVSEYPADKVVFEFLNEPNGRLDSQKWNALVSDLAHLLWVEHAAEQEGRVAMVGTTNWGGIDGITTLVLPGLCTPQNTIVTVHCYDPFHFTHQAAEWVSGSSAWVGTRWTGSDSEIRELKSRFDKVDSWNKTRGLRIFLGEFGVYSKASKPEDRVLWANAMAREAEARGWGLAWWEYNQGFGLFNPVSGAWRTSLLKALVP